jgi:hypothetical protein
MAYSLAGPRAPPCGTLTGTAPVPRARVLLVDLQGMTGDIVAHLLRDDPDCEVVAELEGRAGLLDAVRERRPDLVVVALRDVDVGPDWERLFVEFPALRVMAVTPDGRRACLFTEPLADGLLHALQEPPAGRDTHPSGK